MSQQINSSSMNGANAPSASADAEKYEMTMMAKEFMDVPEIKDRIRKMARSGKRLSIKIDEVRNFNSRLSKYIVKNPIEAIKFFEDELNNTVKGMQEDSAKQNSEKVRTDNANFPKKVQTYYVSFEGNFGKNYVTPRGLKSNLVNQFVQV